MCLMDIFKQNQISFDWKTVYAGVKLDLLKPSEISSYAVELLTHHPEIDDPNMIQLAWREEETDYEMVWIRLLKELGVQDLDLDADIWQIEKRKWRFALLASLKMEYPDDLEELLSQVAEVYADFDYPEGMESFINYLPPPDGFDPSRYTKEENVVRLFTLFNEFLNKELHYLQQYVV
ncbi:DUF2247 family protein [Sporosarcina sp. FSL W7-1349]|uniref:DUF2247 family protein n=1 Tax=Sporosarcina sp. FSL W7-1349 TaxID=2921561 RepID=UPI0030F513F2